jgi:hypothetical protein
MQIWIFQGSIEILNSSFFAYRIEHTQNQNKEKVLEYSWSNLCGKKQ